MKKKCRLLYGNLCLQFFSEKKKFYVMVGMKYDILLPTKNKFCHHAIWQYNTEFSFNT